VTGLGSISSQLLWIAFARDSFGPLGASGEVVLIDAVSGKEAARLRGLTKPFGVCSLHDDAYAVADAGRSAVSIVARTGRQRRIIGLPAHEVPAAMACLPMAPLRSWPAPA
jgi:hypothetical protein